MIRPYWFSEDRWAARGLLVAVVLLTLGMVYLTVLLNQWNNAFYTALQDKNLVAFRGQLFRVTWLIGIFILLAVYQVYLNQMLEIRWRRWLTDRYLRAWLADGAYYRMQLLARETDNPDQRIAEDVHLLAAHTLGLFTGGLRAIVTLVTFVAILWGLSGTFTVPVGGYSITVPGYMVWVAVLYAVAGTFLTDWLGRPLVRLNFDRQRYEADFRFSLVRFRENSEGVALYQGEKDEFRGFRQRFEDVVGNWWGIMRRQKRMSYFTSGYGLGAWIVPSIVAAPRYFRGELGLGGLMQTSQAFQQVQDALSFFVQSYKEIAAWCAVVERLADFERALEQVRRQSSDRGVRRRDGGPTHLTVEGVDLHLPNGQPLMANINLSLLRGETVLLGGASGSGKSTLFRAIAGIWPFGRGKIHVPPEARVLFLPQRPYLPIGALRDVVSYPMPAGGVDDPTLREALEAVGLPDLAGRLDEVAHWALQFSPGEQQRIAFARALVQKPDWLFLDEATSALDEATEAQLYQLVRKRLPDAMMFSIGHRATLGSLHARRLMVEPSVNGPASIVEVPPAPDGGTPGPPAEAVGDREIVTTRVFDAPRELVFRAFSDPALLARWWGPKDFTNTFHKFDLRPGGAWRFVMHGPDGTDYPMVKDFIEVVSPEQIVLQHLAPMHKFRMAMTFADEGDKTRLTWRMLFESVAELEKVRELVSTANEQNFDRLESQLTTMA